MCVPQSIPVFEDLREFVAWGHDVSFLSGVGGQVYLVLDTACAKMCCGTRFHDEFVQRLDLEGLNSVFIPALDPFRFGISRCYSVGKSYLPIAIRGKPMVITPSLIKENPDLTLLASWVGA